LKLKPDLCTNGSAFTVRTPFIQCERLNSKQSSAQLEYTQESRTNTAGTCIALPSSSAQSTALRKNDWPAEASEREM
jgi:hypothetical protein